MIVDDSARKQFELDKVKEEKSELIKEKENAVSLSKRIDEQDTVITEFKELLQDIRKKNLTD